MNLVQSSLDASNGTALFAGDGVYTFTYPGGLTAGHLLVLVVFVEDNKTVSSIAGAAATYAINGARSFNNAAGHSCWMYAAISPSGTQDTDVTITLNSASGENAWIGFLEFDLADSDQSGATANGAAPENTATHGSGSVTPPSANNVVVCGMGRTPSTWVEDGAFTAISAADARFYLGYLLQSAATAQSWDGTSDAGEYSTIRIGAFAGTAAASAANAKLVKTWRQ